MFGLLDVGTAERRRIRWWMSDGGNDGGSEQSQRRLGVRSGIKDSPDSCEKVACLRKLKPLFTCPWLRGRLPWSWNNNSSPDNAGRDWGHQNNQNHTFIRGYERQHWYPVGGVLHSNHLSLSRHVRCFPVEPYWSPTPLSCCNVTQP